MSFFTGIARGLRALLDVVYAVAGTIVLITVALNSTLAAVLVVIVLLLFGFAELEAECEPQRPSMAV